jgi:hypothetical protein
MTDYRALCAELLKAVEDGDDFILKIDEIVALVDRARAALAQPEPVGPTDDEIDALVICIQALPVPDADDLALPSIDRGREMVRKALARFAHPAIAPIPALEAQRETEKACILDIYERLDRLKVQHESNWSRIVKLEEAAVNSSAGLTDSAVPADPRISLVSTVDQAMFDARNAETTHEMACEVIEAVALWLDSQGVGVGRAAARWLREEVERQS